MGESRKHAPKRKTCTTEKKQKKMLKNMKKKTQKTKKANTPGAHPLAFSLVPSPNYKKCI